MWGLIKEALQVWILEHRSTTLRQGSYDAVAYAVERSNGGAAGREDAVYYLQKFYGLSGEAANMQLDSISAKLLGVGANPGRKV